MNLYRVDIRNAPTGARIGAIQDCIGPVLFRQWAKARTAALEWSASRAAWTTHYAEITRISGAGTCKVIGSVAAGQTSIRRTK